MDTVYVHCCKRFIVYILLFYHFNLSILAWRMSKMANSYTDVLLLSTYSNLQSGIWHQLFNSLSRSEHMYHIFLSLYIGNLYTGTWTWANGVDQDEMQHYAAFHQGLHCLLRLKQLPVHHNLETSTCDPLKYGIGNPILIVSIWENPREYKL